MGNIFDESVPAQEEFPVELENFIQHNPKMNHENLYLCQSVDMDGNVVDTKIGVNLMTDAGLLLRYKDQSSNESYYRRRMYLGTGQSAPDPTSSQLTSYISALGTVNGYDGATTYYPFEWDDNTKIWSVKYKVSKQYWDYTQGDNLSYDIYEIGLGYDNTHLFTHALIYDEHGQQTHITKRPNTRLYITAYWTYSLSMADIPTLYEQGKYVYINPRYVASFSGNWTLYLSFLRRTPYYNEYGSSVNHSIPSWTSNMSTITGDTHELTFNKGRETSSTYFWEDNMWYFYGTMFGSTYHYFENMQSSKNAEQLSIITYEGIPQPEELETYWGYVNSLAVLSSPKNYTGDEMNDKSIYRLDDNFGKARGNRIDRIRNSGTPEEYNKYWDYPDGIFPCVDFSISEINMYNHLTKEWDIDVSFIDHPEKRYIYTWQYVYLTLWINYNGQAINAYVYINQRAPYDANGVPLDKILSFNNTNMVIAATDAYWDVSTYQEISNLSAVPESLSRKRYYVIVNGTNASLNPQYSYADQRCHEISLTNDKKGYELTHATSGVMDRIPRQHESNSWSYSGNVSPWNNSAATTLNSSYDIGSQPLFHNGKGWFLVCNKLVFLDAQKNCTTYDILRHEGDNIDYPYDSIRRYVTKNGDRVVLFHTYQATRLSNPGGTWYTWNYLTAANKMSIYTITDASTAPTHEDLLMQFTDNSDINDGRSFHSYSWSNEGYLVAGKKRSGDEFVVVDVYGDGTNATQYVVQNARHAWALNYTKYCVYFDIDDSIDTTYVFKIYDMENRTVVQTFQIDDGPTYTINGIFGWLDFVYVNVRTSDGSDFTFYYNIQNETLEKLSWALKKMRSDCPYNIKAIAYDEECVIFCENFNGTIGEEMSIITANEPTVLKSIGDTVRTYSSYYYKTCATYPCINTINNGRQKIFTAMCKEYSGVNITDLGAALDNNGGVTQHYPYEQTRLYLEYYIGCGCIFPFLDGIIMMSAYGHSDYGTYVSMSGRLFYFPIECCVPLHIKGTTTTLNSYNAPMTWGIDKKLKYNITNDLSRLLPNNNGG